ncbi:MAG: hypothetical protein MUF31_10395 [Akkermansiaceae bacterium]|jgi:hypothetical protein|nr:hypothetical protein [Akkermansiaceae bacterium]
MSNTTATKACENCVHWNADAEEDGECRRHAPQLITFEVDDEVHVESRFPITDKTDWCGDFEAK